MIPKGNGKKKGQCRQQQELAQRPDKNTPGFLEDINENGRADIKGNAEHHKREHNVDDIHATNIETHFYAVYSRTDFRTHTIPSQQSCQASLRAQPYWTHLQKLMQVPEYQQESKP